MPKRNTPAIRSRSPRLSAFAASVALLASVAAFQPALAAPATIMAALAKRARSADNVKLDEGRKPAEILQFLGLKAGMQVLDLFGANAYWSEIAVPVVGPNGHVTIWEPNEFYARFYSPTAKAYLEGFAASHRNVTKLISPIGAPELPKDYADLAIVNDNYHDTYWQSDRFQIPPTDPDAFLKAVFAAMKPGGVIGVIDHSANPNSDTRATVDKYHRIDPNVVKADFERAGFVFVRSSDVLRNPADTHDLEVHDPRIAGHTDRFIFKFMRPR